MRSVSLNHLPQDNKNHTLFIHTTISREGGGGTKCHGSKYTAHIHTVPVQQFKVFTCRHLQYCLFWYIWQRRSYKNWLTLIFWTPQPNPTHKQPTINGHIINHFHQINQTSPYLTMLKVPPITSSLIIHTELNQEVDMQRYIFLITYDVLVSGKMAGYYMMSMMVTCITCFNDILWTSTRDLWSRWWIVR